MRGTMTAWALQTSCSSSPAAPAPAPGTESSPAWPPTWPAPPAPEVTHIELADFELPIYNADLEARGTPEAAIRLKALFHAHPGWIICSPEYNGSYTALLKNTIDWVSSPVKGTSPMVQRHPAFRRQGGRPAQRLARRPGRPALIEPSGAAAVQCCSAGWRRTSLPSHEPRSVRRRRATPERRQPRPGPRRGGTGAVGQPAAAGRLRAPAPPMRLQRLLRQEI
jgi:hypothetical protein